MNVTAALEAILVVAAEPVPTEHLATFVERPVAEVETLLTDLAAEYRGESGGRARGFELRCGARGWRLYSSNTYADIVAEFVRDGASAKLSQAALETLAVIAYRGPVTRGQVSAIRGVSVDGVVRTLTARNLIAATGEDPVTGATLFSTTSEFLDRLGIGSRDELPPLAPHLPGVEALADTEILDFA
ncbi:MAG: SMC-Scp complex subunit ScpB [Cellulomonadaceae bacterium]|jgi:segregation and condensation protein B|nr:SMC-Scp complex subunit ScpB [Cellulomonadaceae bacterium]